MNCILVTYFTLIQLDNWFLLFHNVQIVFSMYVIYQITIFNNFLLILIAHFFLLWKCQFIFSPPSNDILFLNERYGKKVTQDRQFKVSFYQCSSCQVQLLCTVCSSVLQVTTLTLADWQFMGDNSSVSWQLPPSQILNLILPAHSLL